MEPGDAEVRQGRRRQPPVAEAEVVDPRRPQLQPATPFSKWTSTS